LLGSYWQSKTYELLISEPDKEFLLLLELYIDKTGKNLALQSYCGKPMIWSMPLLTQSFQQKAGTWRPVGFVLDLKVLSSAKKRKNSNRDNTKDKPLKTTTLYSQNCWRV
jgi:hypothetical protein